MHHSGEIFLPQVREILGQDIKEYTMPVFSEPIMTNTDANASTWNEFKDTLQPLKVVLPESHDVEFLISPKYVGWGIEDVNIFAGHNDKTINEISDLSTSEGASFFALNLLLAREITQQRDAESVQVSIGFNTEDFSIGHHSIGKLHSHVRAINHPYDVARLRSIDWHSLERFEKLGLIEPFSVLYFDCIASLINDGLFRDYLARQPTHNAGYISMELTHGPDWPPVFTELKTFYLALCKEYETIAHLFTDGSRDPLLDRHVPRPLLERQALVKEFLQTRQGVYSKTSQHILNYLATHLHEAQPRDVGDLYDMSNPSKVYISRGFAGAMTFAVKKDTDTVRFDYLPRVLTTSGIVKTLLGKGAPAIMARRRSLASLGEKQANADYNRFVSKVVAGP